jgi:hydrogenase maturation protease
MILVLALGNPIRGDDGVGLALARGLAEALPGFVLQVIESQEVRSEHADAVARAEGVLFLDAAVLGAPGEVRAAPLVPRPAREAILHALTPEEVLGLSRAVHGRVPPAALVTVAGREFGFVERLSPEVEAALPAARTEARGVVEAWARSARTQR